MIGNSKNYNDAIVVRGTNLAYILSKYGSLVESIDVSEIDRNVFALIGNGELKKNIGNYDLMDCVSERAYYVNYFSYLNQYQMENSKEKFTLEIEYENGTYKKMIGTPKELASLIKDIDEYFTLYSKGEEINNGDLESTLEYLKMLGSEI